MDIRWCACFFSTLAILIGFSETGRAQSVGRNVNVISGIEDLVRGDCSLQRQNEPTIGAFFRNPDHLLAGANDYRFVVGAGDPTITVTKDAWCGVYRSYDRGRTWSIGWIPGFPGDTSPAGLNSPLLGLNVCSDPWIACDTTGRCYYGGLAFDRGGFSNMFVAVFKDDNHREGGDTISLEKDAAGKPLIRIIDRGSASSVGEFVDKDALAVDIPRTPGAAPGACGNAYFAYTVFDGQTGGKFQSKTKFSRSTDCGQTWSFPINLHKTFKQNQGVAIAVDPGDGTVYVVWHSYDPQAILFVKSTDGGQSFSDPISITGPGELASFDQPGLKTPPTFRSNAFPTIAVGRGASPGKIYVTWQERVGPNGLPLAGGRPRIVLTTSHDGGNTWKPRRAIEYANDLAHQVMPAITFAGGVLSAAWYDFRTVPGLSVGRDLDAIPGLGSFISGFDRVANVRMAQAFPGPDGNLVFGADGNPIFSPSVRVSRYLLKGGTSQVVEIAPGLPAVNYANDLMYQGGNRAFIGDYIFMTPAAPFVRTSPGASLPYRWAVEPEDTAARPAHVIWADNRDVIPPLVNGVPSLNGDWTQHTPGGSGTPACPIPASCLNPVSRNANIYTAEVSPGLVAGSPQPFFRFVDASGNPLRDASGNLVQHTYVLYVENATTNSIFTRITIEDSEPGLDGSFRQFSDLDSLQREILPLSRLTFSIFVRCSSCNASTPTVPFRVQVEQITGIGGTVVPGGLNTSVAFNFDPTNPANADVGATESHNPQISAPTPESPTPESPTPESPTPESPTPESPTPESPTPESGSITDLNFTATNEGNITSGFRSFTHVSNAALLRSQGYQFQYFIRRRYSNPGVNVCQVVEVARDQLVSRILNPTPESPTPESPTPESPTPESPTPESPTPESTTYFLAPASSTPSSHDGTPHAPRRSETAQIRLRVIAPPGSPPFTITNPLAEAVFGQAANTGETTPRGAFFDNTPPEVIPTVTPTPNVAGWNNTDVSVSWLVRDLGSGIASSSLVVTSNPTETFSGCPTKTFTNETGGTTLTCSATNRGGLSTSVTITIKIDKTPPNPPTATVSPLPNAAGWHKTVPVTISFTSAGDVGLVQSGVASCTSSSSFSSETAGTPVNGTCTDVAGNTSAPNTVIVKIDLTPPNPPTASLTPTPNAAGWNNTTPVTVNWVSNGDVGPVQSGVTSCTSPSSFTNETAGTPVSGTCTDVAGNTSTATLVTVRIDKTAPTINISSPLNNGNYLLGTPEPANYSCADTLSGVSTCAGPVPNGTNFDTSTFGVKTFTVSATDVAGNTASLTRNYNVIASFIGFLSPLVTAGSEPSPTFSGTFNLGKAIPIKWQLKNSAGAFISDLSSVTKIEAVSNPDCAGPAEGTTILLYSPTMGATGNSILRYVNKDNQFVFNWDTSSTAGLGPGCWNLRVWIYNAAPRVTIVQEAP